MKNSNKTIGQHQGEMLFSGSSDSTLAQRSIRSCIDLILYNGMTMRNIPNLRIKDAEEWIDMPINIGFNADTDPDEHMEFAAQKTKQAFTNQLDVLEQHFGKDMSKDAWLFSGENGQQLSASTIFRWMNITADDAASLHGRSSCAVRREIATLFMSPSELNTAKTNARINFFQSRETIILRQILTIIDQNHNRTFSQNKNINMENKTKNMVQDKTIQQPEIDNQMKPSSNTKLRISKRPLKIIGKGGISSWGYDRIWLDAEGRQLRKRIKLSNNYRTAAKILKGMNDNSTFIKPGDIKEEFSQLPEATCMQRSLKNALTLVLETGFRHDELKTLRLDDISDLDKTTALITINQTKNNSKRVVAISPQAKKIIVSQLANLSREFGTALSRSMPLFPDEHGKPFVGLTLHRRLQRLQQKYLSNLKNLKFSSVREIGKQTISENDEVRLLLSHKSDTVSIQHYMDPTKPTEWSEILKSLQ